jgi:hypothetical protein
MSDTELNQVVELALKLTVSEQAKLLERIAAHLAHEVDDLGPETDERLTWTDEELNELLKPGTPKTGKEIVAMIKSGAFGTSAWSDMVNPHITDSVDWVKALRRDMSKRSYLLSL